MTLANLLEKEGISVSDKERESLSAASNYPLIKIKMLAGGRGAVWIGDFMVPAVTKVKFSSEVNDVTRVHIEMLGLGGVDVEAEAGAVDLDVTVLDKYMPVVVKAEIIA